MLYAGLLLVLVVIAARAGINQGSWLAGLIIFFKLMGYVTGVVVLIQWACQKDSEQ